VSAAQRAHKAPRLIEARVVEIHVVGLGLDGIDDDLALEQLHPEMPLEPRMVAAMLRIVAGILARDPVAGDLVREALARVEHVELDVPAHEIERDVE
jgi:hypothetical protein